MATTKPKKKRKARPIIDRPLSVRIPMNREELDEAHAVALAARTTLTAWLRAAIRAEFLRITTTATTKKKRTPR